MKSILKTMTAATLLLLVTSANALVIQISTNENFWDDPADVDDFFQADDSASPGSAMLMATLGDWSMNAVLGVSCPVNCDDGFDQIHLHSFNLSGGTGTIYIRLSDTGFTRFDAHISAAVGGVLGAGGTASFQSYVDSGNGLFGKGPDGTPISDIGVLAGGAFSGGDSGAINMSGPYSMSIYGAITHPAGNRSSSFDYTVTVPEPSSIALLGLGLVGLGMMATRRRREISK